MAYPRIAALLAIAIGSLVLVGWLSGVRALMYPIPRLPTMVASTAAMTALTGLSLWLRAGARRGPWAQRIALVCAGAAAVFAIGTLLEYALDVELGLDIVATEAERISPWPSGRPAPQTALAFACLALGLLAVNRRTRRGHQVSDFLALVPAAIATIALLGYLFGVPLLYGERFPMTAVHFIGVSIQTALVLLALAIGVLALHVDDGLISVAVARDAGGIVARQLLVGVALFPPIVIAVVVGSRLGWYALPIASAFALFFAFAEGSVFAVHTARRLSQIDAERRRSSQKLADAFEAEHQLRADLEAVDAAREVVLDAVAALHGSDIDPALTQIADQARVLTGANQAAVGICCENPDAPFDAWVTSTSAGNVTTPAERPRPVGVLGLALRQSEPIRLKNVAAQSSALAMPDHTGTIDTLLAMPIGRRDKVIGALYLANKRDASEFTRRDERLVALLADGVARVIETARRHAAERERRVWLQAILDQLPEGVVVVDKHERVQVANQAMMAWAFDSSVPDREAWANPGQFDVRDATGGLLPFEDIPLVRAVRTGQPVADAEYALRQPSGLLLPVEACAAPVYDNAGKFYGAVAIVRDISARKELERLREEWIAVIAHDLRQPILAIRAAAGLLRDKLAPEREGEIVAGLGDASRRLDRMIDDLLDAARIAANRLTLDRSDVDLVAVAACAIEQARLAYPGVTITLRAPSPQHVWVDHHRIEQVLSNLLSNAVKYRAPDTAIDVEITRVSDDDARVAVVNRGEPPDPRDVPNIFGRFARARTAGGQPGLGLGLYICKGLVEAHGGTVGVSASGGTTTFYFTVPMQARRAAAAA